MPWIEFTGLAVFHLTKCRCKSISAFIRQRVKAGPGKLTQMFPRQNPQNQAKKRLTFGPEKD